MSYSWAADAVLVLHVAFVLFVLFGGLLLFRWPRVAWLHMPAAVWGMITEYAGIICPLTPLENEFRRRAGEAGYGTGFIEHYVTRIMYPHGLTRGIQVVLGTLVLALNLIVYGLAFSRSRSRATMQR
jgi:hypothetical protein